MTHCPVHAQPGRDVFQSQPCLQAAAYGTIPDLFRQVCAAAVCSSGLIRDATFLACFLLGSCRREALCH